MVLLLSLADSPTDESSGLLLPLRKVLLLMDGPPGKPADFGLLLVFYGLLPLKEGPPDKSYGLQMNLPDYSYP